MNNKNYDNNSEKKGSVLSSQFHRILRIGSKIGEENIYIEEDGQKEFIKNPRESYIMAVNSLSDFVEGLKDESYYKSIDKLSKEYKDKSKFIDSKEQLVKLRINIKRKHFRLICALVSRIEGEDFGLTDEIG